MIYGNCLSSLSLVSSHSGGISLFSQSTWQVVILSPDPVRGRVWERDYAGGGHVWVNWLKPHASIYAYTEHTQFVDVSEIDNGGVQ